MFVVIASRQDLIARALVARWARYGAFLLTCMDLSVSGWRHRPGATSADMAVVDGQLVPVAEITGVLNRLPSVFEQELVEIIREDRVYVAAEMTAFLLSWLSSLACPMLNRPTPTCLSGPYWRPERWIYTAAQAGIPVRPLIRRATRTESNSSEQLDPEVVTITIVGKQCVGTIDQTLATKAQHLADLAQVDLLAVQFSSPEPGAHLIGVNVWPDIATDGVADAMLAYLQDHRNSRR